MHLISPLAAGISGAGNGTARIYTRGTSARATYFTDFEASDSGSTADITLNSYGRAIVYVNGLVDVVVTKSGVEIARFTAGSNAAAVEVISPGASGTDYETLAVGANKPTTLEAIIDLWPTIAGGTTATFGYVNPFNTGNIPLYQALQASTVFFNVKTVGGAVGDGTTNDTVAIVATVLAAETAGGGIVYFPPGAYRITTAISIPAGVSILGGGSDVSLIKVDGAAINGLVYSEATNGQQYISGVGIYCAQANTGTMVKVDACGLRISGCILGDPAQNGFLNGYAVRAGQTTAATIWVESCRVYIGTGGSHGVRGDNSSTVHIHSTEFYPCWTSPSGGSFTGALVQGVCELYITGCKFNASGITGGLSDLVIVESAANIHGCQFASHSDPSLAINQIYVAAGAYLNESCNMSNIDISANTSAFIGGPGTNDPLVASDDALEGSYCQLLTRRGAYFLRQINSAVTLNAIRYETCCIRKTDTAAQTITFPNNVPPGTRVTLLVWNDQGSTSGTVTLASESGAIRSEFASEQFTVAANSIRQISFIKWQVGANTRWVQDGESTDDETE